MRYRLIDGEPVKIRCVRVGENVASNPPDELIDELKAGWPLKEADAPDCDPETQKIRAYWEIRDGFIQKLYAVEALTEEELKERETDRLNARKEALNLEFEAARNTPIEYENGKKYYPRFVQEYWAAVLAAGAEEFPTVPISDVNNETEFMPFGDFRRLYVFMINKSAEIIQTANAELVEIDRKLEALQ